MDTRYGPKGWYDYTVDSIRSVKPCLDYIIVEKLDGSGYTHKGVRLAYMTFTHVECWDTILVWWNDPERLGIMTPSNLMMCMKVPSAPDTVQGALAYSFPALCPPADGCKCHSLKAWGKVDGNGKWLIEPKF